jgi:hypothetical protein
MYELCVNPRHPRPRRTPPAGMGQGMFYGFSSGTYSADVVAKSLGQAWLGCAAGSSAGRHCHSTLSLPATGCHWLPSFGI